MARCPTKHAQPGQPNATRKGGTVVHRGQPERRVQEDTHHSSNNEGANKKPNATNRTTEGKQGPKQLNANEEHTSTPQPTQTTRKKRTRNRTRQTEQRKGSRDRNDSMPTKNTLARRSRPKRRGRKLHTRSAQQPDRPTRAGNPNAQPWVH